MMCSENEQSRTPNETNDCSKTAYLCRRLKTDEADVLFYDKEYDNKKEYDETDDDRHL